VTKTTLRKKNGNTQIAEDPVALQRKKNEAAIRLLESWCEVDEAEAEVQRETLEFLKKALDEDRMSYRKRFA